MKSEVATAFLCCVCVSVVAQDGSPEVRTLPTFPRILGVSPSEAMQPKGKGHIVTREKLEEWELPITVDLVAASVSNGVTNQVVVMLSITQAGHLHAFSEARLYMGPTPLSVWGTSDLLVPLPLDGETHEKSVRPFHISLDLAQRAFVQLVCSNEVYALELKSWIPKFDSIGHKFRTSQREKDINVMIKEPSNQRMAHDKQ